AERIAPVSVATAPYPGFPTDLQAQWTVLMTQADGPSRVTDTIYTNRFKHIPELNRMGAECAVHEHTVEVRGRNGRPLQGAHVMSTDLRASVSLVLAGLVAAGETHVLRVYHLDRGYENLEGKLRRAGIDIWRGEYQEWRVISDCRLVWGWRAPIANRPSPIAPDVPPDPPRLPRAAPARAGGAGRTTGAARGGDARPGLGLVAPPRHRARLHDAVGQLPRRTRGVDVPARPRRRHPRVRADRGIPVLPPPAGAGRALVPPRTLVVSRPRPRRGPRGRALVGRCLLRRALGRRCGAGGGGRARPLPRPHPLLGVPRAGGDVGTGGAAALAPPPPPRPRRRPPDALPVDRRPRRHREGPRGGRRPPAGGGPGLPGGPPGGAVLPRDEPARGAGAADVRGRARAGGALKSGTASTRRGPRPAHTPRNDDARER